MNLLLLLLLLLPVSAVEASEWEQRSQYHLTYDTGEPIWHIVQYIDDTHTMRVWRENFPNHPLIDGVCGQGVNAYLRTLSLREYRQQRKDDKIFEMHQLCNAYVWPWGQP